MWRDHPRSRGVYAWPPVSQETRSGSSPLARGLHQGRVPAAARLRIIPARAGFTAPGPASTDAGPDHPRSRGVYSTLPCTGFPSPGSSPLARGLRGGRRPDHVRSRIIPARAGFTKWGSVGFRAFPDHPRSRGVYARRSRPGTGRYGSSPLARGLLPAAESNF